VSSARHVAMPVLAVATSWPRKFKTERRPAAMAPPAADGGSFNTETLTHSAWPPIW
jgi:hypothetical protein